MILYLKLTILDIKRSQKRHKWCSSVRKTILRLLSKDGKNIARRIRFLPENLISSRLLQYRNMWNCPLLMFWQIFWIHQEISLSRMISSRVSHAAAIIHISNDTEITARPKNPQNCLCFNGYLYSRGWILLSFLKNVLYPSSAHVFERYYPFKFGEIASPIGLLKRMAASESSTGSGCLNRVFK